MAPRVIAFSDISVKLGGQGTAGPGEAAGAEPWGGKREPSASVSRVLPWSGPFSQSSALKLPR